MVYFLRIFPLFRLKMLCALTLFFYLEQPAFGQQFNFDFYGKGNGLVDNEVHSITQGTNRFMYFGTPSGLSVFDGSSFRNYDPQNGFRHNFISSIQETENQTMLVFTASSAYYRLHDQKLSADSFPQKTIVKNIYPVQPGFWVACSNSGLYVFDKGVLNRLPVKTGKSYQGINCVLRWQDSLLIVGRSYEPLEIYNLHSWKLTASSALPIYVRDICADSLGNVWICTIGSGILLLKAGAQYKKDFSFEKTPESFSPFQHEEFRAIVYDRMGNLWMGSINKGLVKYNPLTREFLHITMDQGLVSNTIFSMYCDREDNLWIGTNRGLQKLVHKNVFSYTSKQGLPADLVMDAISLPDHRVLTCGYSGVGLIQGFGINPISWQPPLADEYFSKFALLNNTCYGLSLKKLIAVAIHSGLLSAQKIYSLPEHFRTMTPLSDQGLLLGGDSSILLFRDGQLSRWTKDSVHYLSCMTMDDSDILWTGNLQNQVVGYRIIHTGKLTTAKPVYQYAVNSKGAQDYLQSMVCDKQGRIICGNFQSGITVLEKMNENLKPLLKINIGSGLSSNDILSLAWYNDSTLLVGTGRGLDKIIFHIQGKGYSVSNLNEYYNFSSSVYSIRTTHQGNILLGTGSGLISIPGIDVDRELHRNSPVIISSVSLPGNPDSLIDFNRLIELPYNNNGLNIHFSSPSYTYDKDKRFVYKLTNGNHTLWSKPMASDNLVFSNLPPGHYYFQVRSLNLSGEISGLEAGAEILIRPPFWQRWWFYLIWITVLSSGLLVFLRKKIKNIRYDAALKSRIAEAEMMALRSQMNPHFIFNCMNIIDSLITSDRKEEAQDFLHKFSRLVRLVLENSMHPLVPLQQDLQALELYIELEVIRNNHHFTYTIKVDEDLLEDGYKIPPLLLQPYIENAIVHGLRHKENAGGKLSLTIHKAADQVVIRIEDNGIGRANSIRMNNENKRPLQHLGMEVTGKRLSLLQKMTGNSVSFQIEDIQRTGDTGTRVSIFLPEHFKFEQDSLN